MRQRIYIDTSVVGGYHDAEFKEYTVPLFERIWKGEFTVLLSTVTQDELENAPLHVQELIRSMKNEFTEFLPISDEGNNSINIRNGYKQLEIRSPRDFEIYEDNE